MTAPSMAGPGLPYACVGSRPAVNDGPRLVETDILDFDGDLYGKTFSTDLLERLRPDERFESLEALVAQMAVDKARAREALTKERH